MSHEPLIPRKWALRAHGQQNVFIRSLNNESARHVIMKAMIWALYLPQYPTMSIEIMIGDKYKPDLVAFDPNPNIYALEKPLFWGESGVVSADKITSITRRYPNTHFVIAKWGSSLKAHQRLIERSRTTSRHEAPFDLLRIPPDSVERFIDADGEIRITHADIEWVRL